MVHVIFRVVVVVALLAGGREFLESRAAKILEVAQEQQEDKLYDESLATLRDLDSWLSWTRAGAEGDELREEIRSALNKKRQRAASDAEYERQMRDIARDREERARTDERNQRDEERIRRHERYQTSVEEARRQAEADRQMERSKEAVKRINRNNNRALRNARNRN